MITIHMRSGELRNQLEWLRRNAERPRGIMQAAARAVRRDLQRHFRDRDKQPNALGGKRTHWWAKVARATNISTVTDTQATITISEPGLGLKVTGGTIRPIAAKALTIPVHQEAYGRRAATVEMITGWKLFVVRVGKAKATFLARSTGDDKLRLLYLLAKSATIKADPAALPDRLKLEDVALKAAEAQLRTEIMRSQRPLA